MQRGISFIEPYPPIAALRPRRAFSLVEPSPHQAGAALRLDRRIQRQGFSLVELSIVLVILGLLTGGILAGQSLIRAAELRSLSAQYQRITTSIYSFRDKYMALPGDMTNATAFWGIAAGTTGNDDTCYQTVSTTQATCNGNGDGWIRGGYTTTGSWERGRAWQHLANAGLIEGSYSGTHGVTASEYRYSGVNVPATRLSNVHWNLFYGNATSSPASLIFFPIGTYNFLELSFDSPSTAREILSTTEQWGLDTKFDDGKPASGHVYAPALGMTWAPNCTTTAVASTAEYDLAQTGPKCFPRFTLR